MCILGKVEVGGWTGESGDSCSCSAGLSHGLHRHRGLPLFVPPPTPEPLLPSPFPPAIWATPVSLPSWPCAVTCHLPEAAIAGTLVSLALVICPIPQTTGIRRASDSFPCLSAGPVPVGAQHFRQMPRLSWGLQLLPHLLRDLQVVWEELLSGWQ